MYTIGFHDEWFAVPDPPHNLAKQRQQGCCSVLQGVYRHQGEDVEVDCTFRGIVCLILLIEGI